MCSVITFEHRGSPILGVNYDFYFGHGLLAANPRGVEKFAMREQSDRLTWRVAYGSVTLNQFGCELPTGGINEVGLAVHLLECEGVEYPPPVAGQPELIELQWLQYVLDTAGNVAEALDTLKRISLQRTFFGLQFALADTKEVAFVAPTPDGYAISRMPPGAGALSNTPLSIAIAHEQGAKVSGNRESLRRFSLLRRHAAGYSPDQEPVAYAFAGLNRVAQRPSGLIRLLAGILGSPRAATVWQTIFVPQERCLVLSTLADARPKKLMLSELDFDSAKNVWLWNLENRAAGNLQPLLKPYTRAANAALVHDTYRYFTRHVSREEQHQIAEFPESFRTL